MDADKKVQEPKPVALAQQVSVALGEVQENVSVAIVDANEVFSMVRDVQTELGIEIVSEPEVDEAAAGEPPHAGIFPEVVHDLHALAQKVVGLSRLSGRTAQILAQIKAELACAPATRVPDPALPKHTEGGDALS